MNDIKSGEKKRLYLYDNLKFLLIVLVVLGHLIDDSTVKLFGDGGGETGVPQAKVLAAHLCFCMLFICRCFYSYQDCSTGGMMTAGKCLERRLDLLLSEC